MEYHSDYETASNLFGIKTYIGFLFGQQTLYTSFTLSILPIRSINIVAQLSFMPRKEY